MSEESEKEAPKPAEPEAEAVAEAVEPSPEQNAADDKPAQANSDDAIFDTLWDRVIESWDDDKVHGALVEYSVRAQMLPELAGRYKELTNDPEKKERAQKRLNGVVMAATQMLMAMKTPPRPPSNKMMNLVVLAIAVAMICYVAYRVMIARQATAI